MDGETKLTGRLVKCWRAMKADVLSIHGNRFQEPHWPDVFVSHSLWTGFIEFKNPNTRVHPEQAKKIKALSENMPAYIVRFMAQDKPSKYWRYCVLNGDLTSLKVITTVGPDGVVAAEMLKTLRDM